MKFVNNEILVRRKGADKWEDGAKVKDPVEVALPDGSNVYIVTKAIKVPKTKDAPDPDFPPEAKRQHKEGQVAMHAVVDEQGRVRSQTVYASSGPEFTNAAIQAVQKVGLRTRGTRWPAGVSLDQHHNELQTLLKPKASQPKGSQQSKSGDFTF